MRPADAHPESANAAPAFSWSPESGAGRFWFHWLAWGFCYLAVVVAWGQRNSWPDDLILGVASLPVNLVVISTLYAVYGFGTGVDSERGQQEQLIAALVLAVGIASGQLLLMDLGLVTLAIAWLRPSRPDVDWTEWLKIPLVLFTTLPFWLDFHGSTSAIQSLLDDPVGNPRLRLPLALTVTQMQLLGYCALLSLTMLLHGRAFWIVVPSLPVFLALLATFPAWRPEGITFPPGSRRYAPWILGIALLTAASWLATRLDAPCRRLISGDTLRRWFRERRYPPWLAVLVVASAQVLPWGASPRTGPNWVVGLGMALVAWVLIVLRRRSRRGPTHSRSVALVAGALLLDLLAEFTTYDGYRRLAVAFVLIGLISWHCFWHWRIFATAGAIAVLLLAVPDELAPNVVPPSVLTGLRTATAGILLVLLVRWSRQSQPEPGETGYPEHAWVPSKRFAFILLALMMLFQVAAAFWPEHQMVADPPSPPEDPAGFVPPKPRLVASDPAASYQILDRLGGVQVSISFPRKNPYLVESPERLLIRNGWQVLRRVPIRHPRGEATALEVERDGQRAATLWWFDQGPLSFSSPIYARRVLWSSWHLTDRRLRQVRLESLAITDPDQLARFAARHAWFPDSPETPPGSDMPR